MLPSSEPLKDLSPIAVPIIYLKILFMSHVPLGEKKAELEKHKQNSCWNKFFSYFDKIRFDLNNSYIDTNTKHCSYISFKFQVSPYDRANFQATSTISGFKTDL